jgi:predicted GIY-YIG superfamily endonuclease
MYYVYILRSERNNRIYTGFTKDLKNRFHDHNAGRSNHTKQHRPWRLVSYFAFENESRARAFEEYLKTGSGIGFARKHFL